MKKKKPRLPNFNKMSHKRLAEWFDTHDLGDYWDDLKDVEMVFDLEKPRDETVVLRLQKEMKSKLESLARSKGLNLSTLVRMWLIEKLQESLPKRVKI